jgi:hypothetical protein
MSSKTVKTIKPKKNAVKIPEPEVNLIYKINLKNRMIHKDSLKTIDIQNEILQKNIEKLEDIITLKKAEKEQNIKLPSEITNHFNNKPWIRIPYPIREIKLVEYTKEMTQEQKEKYLKLLYEKKLTSKVVAYNQTSGLIENISIELE